MDSVQMRTRVVDCICYTPRHFLKCFAKKLYDLISKLNCLPIKANYNERKEITETLNTSSCTLKLFRPRWLLYKLLAGAIFQHSVITEKFNVTE